MFQKNDMVLYRTEGIYKVKDVCVPDISGASDRLYYVMQSLTTDTTAYTPVDADITMRRVVSREVALKALEDLPEMETMDLSTKSHKHLKDFYQKAIQDQAFDNLLVLYKSILNKQDCLKEENKKLCQTDMTFLRKTESLLSQELSIALGIIKDEAVGYLEKSLTVQ
ncbi:hypothetical protein ABB02_02023 [Clostridiaceae bacterium JG1575]|nr:hypothetical protein ABB02_02023 [Clostridiaceae bacterium JG1575]